MKSGFIHVKNDNKKTVFKYLLILIPFFIYGAYKNGYLLYLRNDISFLGIFKPLLLAGLSTIINGLVQLFFYKKIHLNYSYLYVLITAMFVMPNINIFVYSFMLLAGLIIIEVLGKGLNFNKMAFLHLLIIMAMALMGKYSYGNIAEAQNIYAYSLIDYIAGRNTGGIAATNIILGIIAYGYLTCFVIYKKSIPIISYVTYTICSLVLWFYFHLDYHIFFSSMVILAFIFVATETESCPYTQPGMVLYAIILGVITAILSVLLPYEGVFTAILLLSFGKNIFDRIPKKIRKLKKMP
ncbi:MAG: RnfABCDGE type electron transport complex subunit D [Bacilli bacterium]|nr:RnfABCDGE type electron transport complex subunit D [Bacilli bacterium]